MAFYEVTLLAELFGQNIANRWTYESGGAGAGGINSTNLAEGLGFVPAGSPPVYPSGTLLAAIRNMTTTSLIFRGFNIRNLYNPLDFYGAAFVGVTGNDAVETLSPVLAIGFRTNRVRLDIKRATKRIAGISESAIGAGGVITPAFLPFVEGVQAAMTEQIVVTPAGGSTVTFDPVVLGRLKVTLPNGNTSYRYYPNPEAQAEHVARSIVWELYSEVRTQTSRQYGRGD